ncbi:PLDc N-terminal domain-containing protein [Algiphilus sp.]|uniref:PLDc N-terminal domain-containing protein n=1 Tax=Algiphilus sp. TaxID=1872431 RepID=UPI0025BD26B9|nr:PLDc N-terminal domain-containing protein [Algiphilus sp.]MCK5770113.1 PLDc N-terminal domain-containing protein [Algiphilus sp.]
MFDNLGLLGIIHLVVVIWAVLHIVQSTSDTLPKALWIVLVLVLPVLGVIVWFFFGPRGRRMA